MNGSTENTAFGASESPEPRETAMSLGTAREMLPLVKHVVADILHQQAILTRLQPEQSLLDEQRRKLAWPARQRRYQIREEVAAAEHELQTALAELQVLGVSLLDSDTGRIGFPTLVNDRRAYFSWKPGEEGIRSWHFVEETADRPIPASWVKLLDVQPSPKVTR
jgi:hypothetical protein